MNRVFLSYAREDERFAEKIYLDLRQAEINVWMDKKVLLPGQNWNNEIKKAIRESAYFISLISKNSVNKKGYIQNETKFALDVLEEMPKNQLFFIPVRLDETLPEDDKLLNLSWIDLFQSYPKGINRILSVISNLDKEKIEFRDPKNPIGRRALVEYAPFKNYNELIREILNRFPISSHFIDRTHSYYIEFNTTDKSVHIPEYLLKSYPNTMVIILQKGYENLKIESKYLEVDLYFSGVKETLRISYSSIIEVWSPTLNFNLKRFE